MKAKKIIKVTSIAVLVIVILQWMAGLAGTYAVNRIMRKQLAPTASLDRLSLNLFRGTLGIKGLTILQPEGFGEGPLVRVGRLNINIDPVSLLQNRLTVGILSLHQAEIALMKDTNGVLNTSKLLRETESATNDSTPPGETRDARNPMEFAISQIEIHDAAFSFLDSSGDKSTNRIEIMLSNIRLDANDLLYSEKRASDRQLIGSAILDAQLMFRDTPPGFVTLDARLGPLSGHLPGLVAALNVSGLELDSIDPLIPAGVIPTLGGDVLDLDARIQMYTNILAVKANIVSAGAHLPISVSGTPDKPSIDTDAILLGAFGRLGGFVGNTVTDVAGAGLEVGKGAVGLVGAVGKGAGNIVLGVGKGLVETTVSAAKLDVKGMGEGLGSTVSAVGTGAVSTVIDAGSGVASTAGAAGKSALGGNRSDEWRFKKSERHRANVEESRAWVAATAFPEPIDASPAPTETNSAQ